MAGSFRTLNYLLTGISLILILLSQILAPWPEEVQWGVFIILMILSGIPHGATDHLVYKHLRQEQGKALSWKQFFAQYLGLMLLYGLLWYLFPMLSLLLFLLISFYHFGQSELFFLSLPESNWYKKSLYLSWGAGVVLLILYRHLSEVITMLGDILESTAGYETLLPHILPILLIGSGIWTLAGMIMFMIKHPSIRKDILLEIGLSLLLVAIILQQSLLVSFAIYFGLWHAGKTIWLEIHAFRISYSSFELMDWIRAAIPFSLISLLGIALLLWIANWEDLPFHPIILFFIAVSMLTLPHINLVGHLYQKRMDT